MSFAHALVALQATSPPLAIALYKFNFCPADYLHPTRRPQFDGGMLNDQVWETRRARSSLSTHILKSLRVEDKACFDLNHAEWPLILLDADRLDRLQRFIAAFIFSAQVRHSVLHDEVMKWRARLGADAYKFALNGTKLLPRVERTELEGDAALLEAISNGWIEAAMSTAIEPLRLRANLKLQRNSIVPPVEPSTAQRLVHALISILEPEWRSFFPAVRK